MFKKLFIAGIVASILFALLGYFTHGVVLGSEYSMYPQLMRPVADAMGRMPYMIAAHVILGFAFAWIYSQGIKEGVSWFPQGLRYGIAIAFLAIVPHYMIMWSVHPWRWQTVAKQIIGDAIGVLIVGVVTAAIYNALSSTASVPQPDPEPKPEPSPEPEPSPTDG